MKFKIDSKAPATGNAGVKKSIEILNQMADGELISMRVLADKIGYAVKSVSQFSIEIPQEFQTKSGPKNLYGNPKTIKAWNDQKIQN